MAQTIDLLGAVYPDVPSVILPTQGGGTASFVDITDTTATADRVWSGYSFYLADGTKVQGTLGAVPMTPKVYDLRTGYIQNGVWIPENPTNTFADVYEVIAGHTYLITLGGNVGSRFRVMFSEQDTSEATYRITGVNILNLNNPPAYRNVSYTTTVDGFITVAKDNVGKSGIFSYVYDANASWV